MTIINYSLRMLVAALLALVMMHFVHWIEGYWIVLTAVFLMLIQMDNTFLKSQLYLLSYGILLAGHVWITAYLVSFVSLLAVYLVITTFLWLYLSATESDWFMPGLILNLLGFLSAGLPANHLLDGERFQAVLVGVAIALIVTFLVWPDTVKHIWKKYCRQGVDSINKLQQQIFEIYLKRDYGENNYFYEMKLHQYRFAILETLNRMRAFIAKLPLKEQSVYCDNANLLNVLAEAVGVLGSLRYQIKDMSTFEVCEGELQQVSSELTTALEQVVKGKLVLLDVNNIERLEEIFRSTLQVVSQEPMVLLIFINHIKNAFAEINWIAKKNICG